ncbi:MAG: isoprenylcysteine carboxylmethyltransferase family protein [Planctomycetia bacterium]|nr:isoprenylcysteine carboxylmethyltransferase family protein [Planctomycetia bacterium]
MPSETPFRIALLAMLVVTMAVMVYHRFQAAGSGERISRKEEGLLSAVSLRFVGLCTWFGTLAYLIAPTSMDWAGLPLPSWLRWFGAAVGLFSVGLLYWTLTSLGNNLTDTVITRANATLVTTGPYRWVRHPFYVSAGLLMLAATLVASNGFIGLSGLLTIVLLSVRTPKEEQKLIEKFGDPYRVYVATTGQFWPKMKRG